MKEKNKPKFNPNYIWTIQLNLEKKSHDNSVMEIQTLQKICVAYKFFTKYYHTKISRMLRKKGQSIFLSPLGMECKKNVFTIKSKLDKIQSANILMEKELIELFNRLSEKDRERMLDFLALVEIAREKGIKIPIDEVDES